MEKAKAIELLKNAVPQDESLDEEGLFIEAVNMAIKALKKAETNLPEIPDSWIPVSERLPEKEDCPMDCLVTRKSKNIGNYTDMAVAESDGTWTHEDWKAITFGDRVLGKKVGLISTRDDDIVAWMPLPEPWKGE